MNSYLFLFVFTPTNPSPIWRRYDGGCSNPSVVSPLAVDKLMQSARWDWRAEASYWLFGCWWWVAVRKFVVRLRFYSSRFPCRLFQTSTAVAHCSSPLSFTIFPLLPHGLQAYPVAIAKLFVAFYPDKTCLSIIAFGGMGVEELGFIDNAVICVRYQRASWSISWCTPYEERVQSDLPLS